MLYRYYTADVFTKEKFRGNQLAVIPDAKGLDDVTMQSIAREFNFSETVFVMPAESPVHTRKLRIFTPGTEVPFAGHPTIGTAYILSLIGDIDVSEEVTDIIFEEGAGPVPVRIKSNNSSPDFIQLSAPRLPEIGPKPPDAEALSSVLSLSREDLTENESDIEALSCGLPFLFVPLRSIDAVRRSHINLDRWKKILSSYWAPDVYLFSHETELPGSTLHARMYGPGVGVSEDPATGSAVTALGGYMASRDKRDSGTLQWVIEQGFEIGRHSILHLEVEKLDGRVNTIRVGGHSVLVFEGHIEIP